MLSLLWADSNGCIDRRLGQKKKFIDKNKYHFNHLRNIIYTTHHINNEKFFSFAVVWYTGPIMKVVVDILLPWI